MTSENQGDTGKGAYVLLIVGLLGLLDGLQKGGRFGPAITIASCISIVIGLFSFMVNRPGRLNSGDLYWLTVIFLFGCAIMFGDKLLQIGKSDLPHSARYAHQCIVYDNKMWIIGGVGGFGGADRNDVLAHP